jgi:DNA-binding CsgD family transcriptional regulator
MRTRSAQQFSGGEVFAPAGVSVDPKQLSATLIVNSPLGVGIWDRRLRFRVVNKALASMNGHAAEDHLGKPLHKMIGAMAEQVAPTRERVFATGELLNDVHYGGLLPTRSEPGHWIETSFPLRDGTGKIAYVGAIILEVTQLMKLRQSVQHLAGTLRDANSALNERRLPVPDGLEPLLSRSVSQLCAISDFLTPTLLANIAASLRDPLCQFTLRDFADLSNSAAPPRSDTDVPLSARERQVLRLLALSKTNKEIAGFLNISVRTIETYRGRLMLKLGLHSVPQLVRYAIRNHII